MIVASTSPPSVHMLDRVLLARLALSFLCVVQGVGMFTIDFNRTHATNPLWTGHARIHLVWQSSTTGLLQLLGLVLIWASGSDGEAGFYLAAVLAALSPLGFLTALLSRRFFAGTLSDPNGIHPVRLKVFGTDRLIDLNLCAVVAALLSLWVILTIYRH